jgi:CrcB protein
LINSSAFWLVGLSGVAGTLLRYYLGQWIVSKTGTNFPWATWVINLTGSLLLGILFTLFKRELIPIELWWMLGVGFCGAYTTFSTFGYETQQLIEYKQYIRAAIYMISSIILGLFLAWCGILLVDKFC